MEQGTRRSRTLDCGAGVPRRRRARRLGPRLPTAPKTNLHLRGIRAPGREYGY